MKNVHLSKKGIKTHLVTLALELQFITVEMDGHNARHCTQSVFILEQFPCNNPAIDPKNRSDKLVKV